MSKATPQSNSDTDSAAVISLDVGRCFGRCKVYRLDIEASGKATFTGTKNVKKTGVSSVDLPREKLKDLLHLFEKEGFSELDSQYLSGAKDLQVIEISYKNKAVTFHKMKAPQSLRNLLKALQTIVDDNGW